MIWQKVTLSCGISRHVDTGEDLFFSITKFLLAFYKALQFLQMQKTYFSNKLASMDELSTQFLPLHQAIVNHTLSSISQPRLLKSIQ